ncbi:Putative ubiquitin-conjugating enzyme family [Zea mays]|uniref:Putative ubiquitin-conjugating enzyme family n=1 Tax=Zea mays TaxID=4577 RepID=A0A1D6G1E2_MAIZE|nr:Putative ubiquitin-conjugating enzyme family [Zea mays]AQK97245.1 Putative ubiquitin-conjugating enzyme family [Zea mays]
MKHTTGTSGNRFLRWQGDTWRAIPSNHLGLGTCKVKQGDTLCQRITRGLAQPSRQLIYHSVPDSSSRTTSDAAPPQPPSLSLHLSLQMCCLQVLPAFLHPFSHCFMPSD